MQNCRHELKKQIVKRYIKPTINSNRKRDCILHLLQVPSVEEIWMIQEYISILKFYESQTHTNQHTQTQFLSKKSKLRKEKKNVSRSSKSAKNKHNFKDDFKFKIVGEAKKQYKNQKKIKVDTPTRPIPFHSIFDNNLLRANGGKFGCECTAPSGYNYENPFFEDLFEKLTNKKFTVKCAVVGNNTVSKGHLITFRPIEEFHHIITTMKPTLCMSEYVTGTRAAIGITYSLIIRLTKNHICVGEYVVKHTFTHAKKKFLEISICNYRNFDTIYYYHVASTKPGVKFDLEKVMSIKIGKSVLMFLSKTIQWTEPGGPNVIVENADQPSKHLFY